MQRAVCMTSFQRRPHHWVIGDVHGCADALEQLLRRLPAGDRLIFCGDAINRGLLPPMEGWWKISTVPPKRVTVDAGREAQQNRADVEMGLKTLSDHFAELGADFGEEIERRAADAKLILETATKYDVPVGMLWKVAGPL